MCIVCKKQLNAVHTHMHKLHNKLQPEWMANSKRIIIHFSWAIVVMISQLAFPAHIESIWLRHAVVDLSSVDKYFMLKSPHTLRDIFTTACDVC